MLAPVLSRIAVIVVGAALAGCTFQGPGGVAIDASTDTPDGADPSGRVVDHLIALWRFDESSGAVIADTVKQLIPSFTKAPMDLTIGDPTMTRWTQGSLQIDGPALIKTTARAHLAADVGPTTATGPGSHAVTLELWLTPASVTQGMGPMRATVFSYGAGATYTNLRILQEGEHYVGNARTASMAKGTESPIKSDKDTAAAALQHVVLVADASTRAIYVDGTAYPGAAPEALASWNDTFTISVGDDSAGGAPWRGQIWLIAIYDRVLTPEEIEKNRSARFDCSSC